MGGNWKRVLYPVCTPVQPYLHVHTCTHTHTHRTHTHTHTHTEHTHTLQRCVLFNSTGGRRALINNTHISGHCAYTEPTGTQDADLATKGDLSLTLLSVCVRLFPCVCLWCVVRCW